jgi:hypothetical protein
LPDLTPRSPGVSFPGIGCPAGSPPPDSLEVQPEPYVYEVLGFIPTKYPLIVLVAQCLGLPVSEIVGLKWEDLDFEAGTVLVQRSVVHGRVDSE